MNNFLAKKLNVGWILEENLDVTPGPPPLCYRVIWLGSTPVGIKTRWLVPRLAERSRVWNAWANSVGQRLTEKVFIGFFWARQTRAETPRRNLTERERSEVKARITTDFPNGGHINPRQNRSKIFFFLQYSKKTWIGGFSKITLKRKMILYPHIFIHIYDPCTLGNPSLVLVFRFGSMPKSRFSVVGSQFLGYGIEKASKLFKVRIEVRIQNIYSFGASGCSFKSYIRKTTFSNPRFLS